MDQDRPDRPERPEQPVAVVTGATGGIGGAVVERLAAERYAVLALGRDRARLDHLEREHPQVTPVVADLAEPAALAAAIPRLDRVDALLHCHGIADQAPVEQVTPELWRRMLDINLVGTAELTRVLLPGLRAARGHVVFVHAAYRLTGRPSWSAYLGSKAAQRELADSLRAEERAHGLRVTSVYPAGVDTPLLRATRAAQGRDYDPAACVRPETLAAVLLTVLRTPSDAHVTDLAIEPAPPS